MRLQIAVLAMTMLATSAHALGTASGTDIDNRATVSYDLGNTAQTPIESDPSGNSTPGATQGGDTTFVVDNRIDFTLSELDAAYTIVAPNSTFQAVAFELENIGNTTQDFSFTVAPVTTGNPDGQGGTDDFDATPVGIFVETNGTPGYQQGADTDTYIDNLAADALPVVVYVVQDIGNEADDTSAGVVLTAQVADGSTATVQGADITSDDAGSADVPGTVQIVFADGAGDTDAVEDGTFSATDAYLVQTATLLITKTSTVYWDPFNLFTNPKAIPGALVEYEVEIQHTGGTGTATSVSVVDDMSVEIGNGTIVFATNGYSAGNGIEVEAPNLYAGAATELSTAGDGDEGDFNDTTANTLTVTGIEVAPGQTAYVRYLVEIQ